MMGFLPFEAGGEEVFVACFIVVAALYSDYSGSNLICSLCATIDDEMEGGLLIVLIEKSLCFSSSGGVM